MAANPPSGASVLDVRNDGLGFSPFYLNSHTAADISENAFEIAEVFAYVCELGEMQLANVFKAIKEVYVATGWNNGEKGERLPTIEEFAEAVERVEKGARGRNARERLLPLTDFGLFLPSSMPFEPRGTGGGGLVVDLHRFKLEQVIRAATALILRKVYREMFLWPQDSTLKLALVLDEAHRIAKDPTLPKLMKEGRKYGVACFVASQSISDFDDDVTNNSGTKIVFRTNFPESKDVAGLIRGGEKVDFAKQIEQLRVGEAFVSTSDMSRARKCRMRSGSS
jgi:DNA helicase HerA-like ATPase